MHKDSISKTIMVATALCVVCAILVSTAAVQLKPLQERNKVLETKRNILEAAGLMTEGGDIEQLFEQIEPRLVDLNTANFTDAFDPAKYDERRAAKDPGLSEKIPGKDIAKIRRRAKVVKIYLVKDGDQLQTIILPLYGKGLWSTMYAFIALDADGNKVKGLTFYDHGETPGLGGEVENPLWKNLWPGKLIYDEKGEIAIQVIKGKAKRQGPQAMHTIDGLGGSTLTTRGVNNLVRYWLGEEGFAPFLRNLIKQGGKNG